MTTYRKRPIEVRVLPWSGNEEDLPAARDFLGTDLVGHRWHGESQYALMIRTMERGSTSDVIPPGWILIEGVRGEHYACRADVFAETYAPAVVSAPVQPTTRADDEGDELVCVDQCGACDACGMEPFGTPAEGWREASRFLRRVARTSGNREGALHGARLIEAELRRMAGEEQPATATQEPICRFDEGCHRVIPCDPGCGVRWGRVPQPATETREADPDCERCEGSGLDPDASFVNKERTTWTPAPCSECFPDEGDPVPTERVRHSGPDTKFCVLCQSGEHERVDDDPPVVVARQDGATT
ncbi:hypothetical protein ACWENS_10515 [Streptomyces sp. NPDC004532]